MANPQVSIYNCVHDTNGIVVPLDAVIQRIKSGDRGLKQKTQDQNQWYHENPVKYRERKTELPAVTWSGTFPKGKRNHKSLVQHSGYVVLDVEPKLDLGTVLADFAQNPHVRFAFVSPSGEGAKPVIPVYPIPRTPEEHKAAFRAVLEAFSEYAEQDPVDLTKQDETNRLCFLAWDARPIDNPNAIPVEWELEAVDEPQPKFTPVVLTQQQTANIDAFVKKYNVVFDENGKSQYFPKSTCINAAEHKSNNKAVQFFRNDDGSVNGYCNGCKAHWYVVQPIRNRNRKPVRLHKNTDIECILEPLEKSREVLKSAFEKGSRFIGVRADTGVGKNYQAEMYFFYGGFAGYVSTPSTELAKEQHARFRAQGIKSYRWRGVASEPNGEFPHEKPCMFPDEYNALSEKGRNPVKTLCDHCPFRTECDESGYRSQEKESKKYDVIVGAHRDLLLNPTYRKVAERLLPSDKEDLIVVDELDIIDSFNKVEITQSRLETLRDMWSDSPLGKFAKQILDATVVQDAPFTGVSYAVEMLADYERDEIIQRLEQFRTEDGAILDADQLQDYEKRFGKTASLENIKKLPMLEPDAEWNMLTKLELFFDTYHHAETAPIEWKDNILTFYVPPLPMYTKARVIMMSATLNEMFFRQVFRVRQQKRGDVDFVDLVNTEWHPDAKVFQLRTNRNPRRTLLEGQKDEETGRWSYGNKLTATGQNYMDVIRKSISDSKTKCGFIGHKTVVEHHTDDIDAATGHFGGLIGLNEHFYRDEDDGIELHILGTPNVGQDALETACKLLIGMTDEPLDFTRNDDGTFNDPNVQTVADAIVQDEITQAVGRGGLVKNPSKVVIWSSYDLPSITHREQTILFDENDWELAGGNLDALPEIVAERQVYEKELAEAIDKGDVDQVADLKNVSKGHARKLTQEPRQKNTANKNAERDAKIVELHQQGVSQRKIKDETGFSLGTISRVLKVHQNAHAHVQLTHVDARNGTPPENLDVACLESETPKNCEVNPLSHSFLDVLQIGTLFYGKHQITAGEISQWTGHTETQISDLLSEWYEDIVISAGAGESYWMSGRDRERFESKIIAPLQSSWESIPGHLITSEPIPESIRNR